jgi:uncharacterized protein (TIGR03083 family)
MDTSWEDSRTAYIDAAEWFVRTTTLVGDRWSRPGLGEWDVRSLVGHTSRAFLTVEEYLDRPAAAVELDSAADYFRAVSALAASDAVTQRGRDAGADLGADPAVAVAEIAARVLQLLGAQDGTELITTIAGGMRLHDYLLTRTFELVVHTLDLADALGASLEVPPIAAAQALSIVSELALFSGNAGRLLLVATGRPLPTSSFSVL